MGLKTLCDFEQTYLCLTDLIVEAHQDCLRVALLSSFGIHFSRSCVDFVVDDVRKHCSEHPRTCVEAILDKMNGLENASLCLEPFAKVEPGWSLVNSTRNI